MAAENSISMVLALKNAAVVEHGLQKVQGAFLNLAKAAAAPAIAALSVGTFTGLIKHAIDTADEFGKLSQKIGVTTEALSGFAYSAKLSDASTDDLRLGLREFADYLNKAGRGSADLSAELLKAADQFAAMPEGIGKVNRAVELFGARAGTNLIPWLSKGAEGMREDIAEATRLGKVIGPEFAANAEHFKDSMTKMSAARDGFFLKLSEAILPDLTKQMDALNVQLGKTETSGLLKLIGGGVGFVGRVINTEVENLSKVFSDRGSASDFVTAIAALTNPAVATLLKGNPPAAAVPKADKVRDTVEMLDREKTILAEIADSEAMIKRISADPFLIGAVKDQERLVEINRQLKLVDEQITTLNAKTPQRTIGANGEWDKASADHIAQSNALLARRSELQGQQASASIGANNPNGVADPASLIDQMNLAFVQLETRFGTLAQMIARAFSDIVLSAVDSVANGIQGLINGTMRWGDALRNIGMGVINGIISAVSRLAAEYIVQQVLIRGAMLATHIYSLALQAKAMAVSAGNAIASFIKWIPAAIASSVGSYGAAAIIGAAAVVGVLAAYGAGAFKEGGYTGNGGVNDVAGVVHGREFVFDAGSVQRVGVGNLEAMRQGTTMAQGGQNVQPVNISFHGDATRAKEFLEDREGINMIVDIVNKHVRRY